MDTQVPKKREKIADKEGEERSQKSPTSTSPPSASSSPSHEFSFTISLHPSSAAAATTEKMKSQPPPSSFAIDLSPADDIFFHGHLLPLHLLSHLPVSPRSSTNSFDSFNLPLKDILEDSKPSSNTTSSSSISSSSTTSSSGGTKGRTKLKLMKSLSLFGLTKWQKGSEFNERDDEDDDDEEKKKKQRKIRFDVGHILKRYVRMVQPLLIFGNGRKENDNQFLRKNHSFSGNLSNWKAHYKQENRGRRRSRGGLFSAPASMRTSPSNSGLLIATEALPSHNTSDSTMEELQSAIQAAIAHCKNSISMKEEKLQC